MFSFDVSPKESDARRAVRAFPLTHTIDNSRLQAVVTLPVDRSPLSDVKLSELFRIARTAVASAHHQALKDPDAAYLQTRRALQKDIAASLQDTGEDFGPIGFELDTLTLH